ncbi:hypothetical protein PtB15_5B716 [Puccinia triticina]|nr:hypothetical protein PtB15_5B716 [Puccinia triticina]
MVTEVGQRHILHNIQHLDIQIHPNPTALDASPLKQKIKSSFKSHRIPSTKKKVEAKFQGH